MKCANGCARAHVRLIREDKVVCWHCYNRAVYASTKRVQAKMLRRYYR